MISMRNFNDKIIKKGQTVAVALSGGEDSVCLFHFLYNNAEIFGIRLKAINVEHGIRGEKSVKDSEFVRRLCDDFGVELLAKKVDSYSFSKTFGLSLEDAARTLRYGVFFDAIASKFCDVVATAHHLSDNAETVLMNLFRGGVSSLSMTDVAYDGRIVRPMLHVLKSDVREYVAKNGLEYVVDETNYDEAYSRNFVRHRVLPVIKEKFPFAERSIDRFAGVSSRESVFLDKLADKELIYASGETSVPIELDEVIFCRACVLAMKSVGTQKDYEKRHIDALIDLRHKKNGTVIDLVGGVRAVKDYDRITIYKPNKNKHCHEAEFSVGKAEIDGVVIDVSDADKVNFGDGFLYFDGDKIPCGAKIRRRQTGDEFVKFGGGRKKLKDYLIDKKIPSRKRDELFLLTDKNIVLIIFGIEISDLIKVDKNTQNVLKCNIYDIGEGKWKK